MSGYISELLDYLDLYKVLLENGYYDPSKIKEADELIDIIDSLNECKSSNDYGKYDFKLLKRKISSIFHPDIYKANIPAELNIDNVELLSKVYSILDDIGKGKKENSFIYNTSKPFYNDYEERYREDYTKNDYFYDDERFTPREKDEELKREQRRKERREKFGTFFEGVKTDFVETKDYICEVARERFNAVFRDIPANEKDYNNIKKRFEGSLNSLSSREMALSNTLLILRRNYDDLITSRNYETSNYAVDRYYKMELDRRLSILKNAEMELRRAEVSYRNMLVKYAPEYNRLMQEWVNTSSEIYTDIMNANNELNEKVVNGKNSKDIKEVKKRIDRLNKERDNYPNINEAKTQANNHLLSIHEDYKEAFERFYMIKAKYDEAYKEYDYWYNHEREEKDNYYNKTNEKYNEKIVVLENKIKSLERKHLKISRSIFDTRQRYEKFLEKYQDTYETDKEYTGSNTK